MQTSLDPVSSSRDDVGRARGWQAELRLGIQRVGSRSVVVHRRHRGPLALQRALYPELDGTPHLYLLHPPGGLVGGDELEVDVRVGDAAAALLTTPAATKVYRARADARASQQTVTVDVARGGRCEWLPGETIVFTGARVRLATRVSLADDARFLGWELVCLGRPACSEPLSAGGCELRLEVTRAGRPLVLERTRLDAGTPMLTERWGAGGAPVIATLVAAPDGATDDDLAAVRDACAAVVGGDLASATRVDGAIVCRYLGASVERARRLFVALWQRLRPTTLGRDAVVPRIWAT
jgi:urease accessory protein